MFMIIVEFYDGKKHLEYKMTKWSLARVSAHYQRKFRGLWSSVEVKRIIKF